MNRRCSTGYAVSIAAALLGVGLISASAKSADLAGAYDITVKCSLGNGYGKLKITSAGGNSYRIIGQSRGGTYSGSIRGGQFSMQFSGSGNLAIFTASNIQPGKISGNMTQKSSFGGSCAWIAARTSSPTEEPKKSGSKSNSKPAPKVFFETEEGQQILKSAKSNEAAARALLKSYNCSNLRKIDTLIAKAAVDYKRVGYSEKSAEMNRLGEKISGEGGALDKCQPPRVNKVPGKPKVGTLTRSEKEKMKQACLKGTSTLAEMRANGLDEKPLLKKLIAMGCAKKH